MSPRAAALFGHELLVVTGKGGAGKTTVAAALGVAAARRGLRTIVAEVSARDDVQRALGGEEAARDREVELAFGVHHTSIDPDGPECYCGSRGCVETYISGSGLERRHAEATGRPLAAEAIVQGWRAGEAHCAESMDAFFARFGRAVANLIAVLDPDLIAVGGGLSNIDELYTRGVDEVARRVFSDSLETPIVRNVLGDSAGVIGAALVGV